MTAIKSVLSDVGSFLLLLLIVFLNFADLILALWATRARKAKRNAPR